MKTNPFLGSRAGLAVVAALALAGVLGLRAAEPAASAPKADPHAAHQHGAAAGAEAPKAEAAPGGGAHDHGSATEAKGKGGCPMMQHKHRGPEKTPRGDKAAPRKPCCG